jgi:parallel beta-helix repeat protein
MKSKLKKRASILIVLGIFFAISSIYYSNPCLKATSKEKSTDYSDYFTLDRDNLKISALSGKIHIINNSGWVDFKNDGNCTGNGNYSDPYVIEDLVIDGGGSGSCILIENSNIYFKIENCSIYNSGGSPSADSAGILLNNTDNGNLISNNCSNNYIGIYLFISYNNTISGNTASYNVECGICLDFSDYNTISGNTANNNYRGIYLYVSRYNSISGSTVSYNIECGIYLWLSDYNIISGNTANNNYRGIYLHFSDYNIISGNTASNNEYGIFLYSNNNRVFGNTVSNNEYGIYLYGNSNRVSGNTVNNNGEGIYLWLSDYNIISGNTANNNSHGIYLWLSDYNTVSGNTLLGNDECIVERNCEGNIFENNDCGEGDGIPLELIVLISVFCGCAVIGVVTVLLIRTKRKSIQ